MKNREFRTLIAGIMLSAMVVGSLGTTGSVYAADSKQSTKVESTTKKNSENKTEEKESKKVLIKQSSAEPTKDETVYAKIDESGNVTSVTVSDKLKNISDQSQLKDTSTLTDIENVKGDETFSQSGNSMTWDVDGSDICYQGTTNKALPVGVKITYTLDGKEISAADLEGKSGHLIIRYTYLNTTGDNGQYAPFLMATGVVFGEDNFKNIKVTNGKLLSDGERDMAIGYGIPKMKEELGVEDLDIPDYFEIEADVTDYDAPQAITLASNSFLNEINTDDITDVDDLQGSLDKMQDAANQLVDGSGQLKDGLDTLLDKSGDLTSGIDQLVDGGKQLTDGTSQLVSGADQLNAGAAKAAAGVNNTLLPGAKQLDDGVTEMQTKLGAAIPTLATGVSSLNDGAQQLSAGTSALKLGTAKVAAGAAQLNQGMNTGTETTPSLVSGADAVNEGVGLVADGTQKLNEALNVGDGTTPSLVAGATGVKDGVDKVATGVTGLSQVRDAAAESTSKAATDAAALAGQVAGLPNEETITIKTEVTGDVTGDVSANLSINCADEISSLTTIMSNLGEDDIEAKNQIQEVINSLAEKNEGIEVKRTVTCEGGTGTAEANVTVSYDKVKAVQKTAASIATNAGTADVLLNKGTTEVPGMSAILGQMTTQLPTLTAGASALNEGVKTVATGAAQLDAAVNTGDATTKTPSLVAGATALNEGVKTAAAGAAALDAGINVGDIVTQTPSLVSAVEALDKGVNGTGGLKEGAARLNTGVNDKETGLVAQVNSGVSLLKTGTSQLVAGIDGTDGLAVGLNALSAGASQLATGTATLDTGANTLSTGLGTLKDGSGQLVDGVTQLDEGATKLDDGMAQFKTEAVDKIVDVFDGDLETLVDKLDDMLNAAKSYKNFSGISSDMDGEVKFIFVADK